MIWIVMPILIVLMFMLGIGLDRNSFAELKKQPWSVLAGLFGQIVVLPAIAFALGIWLELPPVYFLGLMLVACSPGGSSSNAFSMLAGGNVALSVTLTACSSIITLFTLPLIMTFFASYISVNSDVTVVLPVGKLIMQNIVLIFVPIILGILFRVAKADWAHAVEKVLKKCAFPALMLLALVFFLQYTKEIIASFTTLGLAAGLLILCAMLAGQLLNWLFGFSKAVSRTINIEIGMQNAAQAIAIATSPFIFNNVSMALPAIIYALLMNVILLTYVWFIKRKDK
ncbi:MAG: bile acid:sodium symporter family protein [Bacteroidaceae bacterium]|nr:bile acid:sodium symporter family protein [Bacteroidaceae bacterium]